jgi:hypothetical protein
MQLTPDCNEQFALGKTDTLRATQVLFSRRSCVSGIMCEPELSTYKVRRESKEEGCRFAALQKSKFKKNRILDTLITAHYVMYTSQNLSLK